MLGSCMAVLGLVVGCAASVLDGLREGVIAYERDTTHFYYPLAAWTWQQLHVGGEFPLWSPELYGGYPIFADGEHGLASPLVLVALLLLSPERAFVAVRLVHLCVAALGGYALARAWRLPRTSATLAGLTFALGSFLQAQVHHENVVRTAAWLPLSLACLEHALRSADRARFRWAAASAVTIGLSAHGLHAQILAIDLLVVGLYTLLRGMAGPVRGAGRVWQRSKAIGAVAGFAVLFGVAIAGVQLVPFIELAWYSQRGQGMSYAQAASYSLTPYSFVQLVFPYFFRHPELGEWGLWTHWETYLYVGLVPLTLALIALVCVRRAAVWLWAALGGVGLLLALGQNSPLNLHFLLWLVPGMSGLRAPGRFTLVVVLAFAMLAAHGLTWLRVRGRTAGDAPRSLRLVLTGLLLAPATIVVVFSIAPGLLLDRPDQVLAAIEHGYLAHPRDALHLSAGDVYSGLLWSTNLANPHTRVALAGLAVVAVLLCVWQLTPVLSIRRWPGWPALLVVAVAADLLSFTWWIHPRDTIAHLAEPHPAALTVRNLLDHDSHVDGPYRVLASPTVEQVTANRLAPLQIQEANGYSSLELQRHHALARRILSVDDDLLDLWNVRYLLEPAEYGPFAVHERVRYQPDKALLRAPAGGALSEETFRVAPGPPVNEIRLVTALVNAASVPQGTPAAEIVLRGARGEVLARHQLLTGRDVMEWAWEHPAIHPLVKHVRVPLGGLVYAMDAEGRPEARLLSYGVVPFEPPVVPTTVDIHSLVPAGEFVVYGAALVDSAGGASQLFGRRKTKYREVFRGEGVAIFENTAAYPRAFVVPRARAAPPEATALDLIETQPFRPAEEVVLARDTPPDILDAARIHTRASVTSAALGSRQSVSQIEEYGLSRISIRVTSSTNGFLVLSDTYYPGWQVLIDGQPQFLFRGDLLFRVVAVPAGTHMVTFRFEPRSVWVGGVVSASALVILACVATLGCGRRVRTASDRRRTSS